MKKLFASVVVLFAVATGRAYAASPIGTAEASALADRYGRPVLTQMLRDKGNTQTTDSFEAKRLFSDDLSQVHYHVRQMHAGIPVWNGEAIVHLNRDGSLVTVTDDFLTKVSVKGASLSHQVTQSRAIEKALQLANFTAGDLSYPATAELWIFRHASGDKLAWRVRLNRTDGSPNSAIPVIFIDANSGDQLWSYDDLQTGTGNSMYVGSVPLTTTLSGGVYQLKDGTRGNQATYNLNHGTSGQGTLFTDSDDVWGNGTTSDLATAAVDAQFGTAVTWDYYKNVHGRSGIRNDGVGAYNRVHYSNNYVNAFWDDSCFCMTYGDGSGNAKPLTSIDVAGHEMSHGVTSNTAGLVYSGESGGLNEATSDIFGTSIEFYANNANDVGDYLIGEKININGNGTPLRYMDSPNRDGSSANCWSSTVGNLDVHYSSGVANHFFYLLSEGSGAKTINGVSYNSPTCNSSTVTGITRAKAEKIWYRALSVYMTSSTNYAAAKTATMSAAADLYGAGSVEQNTVSAAWAAVNVGAPAPPPTALTNGVPVSNLSASTGGQLSFTLAVPSGSTNLSFNISGGTGDADLYVKFGSAPTLTSYDCRPYVAGNSETCSFATPQTGTYYVMLNGYSTFSGVSLVGSYSSGGGGGGTLQNGTFETGSLTPWTSAGSNSVVTGGHSGTYTARAGSTLPTSGDSSISQTFTAPSGSTSVKFFYKVVCPDTVTYDWATATLRNNSTGATTTVLAKTCTNNGTWSSVTSSITAGTSYTLTLTSHDDNYSSDPTYVLYDDVTVQ